MRVWNRWSSTLYLGVALILLLLVTLTMAQVAGAQEATPESPPVVVVANPAESVITNGGVIVMALLLAFATGGATVGAALLMFARSIRTNPELARAIERLYLSTPADRQVPIRQIIVGAKEGIDLAEELTDGRLDTPASSADPEGGAG